MGGPGVGSIVTLGATFDSQCGLLQHVGNSFTTEDRGKHRRDIRYLKPCVPCGLWLFWGILPKPANCQQIRNYGRIKRSSGSSSVVERDLAKVDVAGSTPVSRSRFLFDQFLSPTGAVSTDGLFPAGTLTYALGARYPSGKGEVCKTFMRRFDSDPRLQNLAPSNPHKQRVFLLVTEDT